MRAPFPRLGRFFLRVLPRDFRERFGEDIADYFKTRSAEVLSQKGPLEVVRFWIKSVLDLVGAGLIERREERAMQKASGDGGLFSHVGPDIRFALRALRRTPGFTFVALLTLALGIGATTAMFSVMNTALFRPLPFPEPHRLVLARATFDGNVNPWVSFPDYQDYRDQAASLESLATIGGGASLATITGADEPEQASLTFITGNLFQTLGVPPAMGTTFTIDELPATGAAQVVISHSFWQRWFGGSPDVVGQTLIIDGGPATVMGVMPLGFRFLYDVDLWVPPWPGNSDPITRRFHNWLLVGRLSEGISVGAAQAEVDVISAQLEEAYLDSNQGKALQLDGLHGAMVEDFQLSLLVLVGAIVLVLLIACTNVASLLMSRGSTRAPELAIRAAMGAGRTRLTRQLLVECLVLALGAGMLGVLLAVWIQDGILGFVPMDTLGIREGGLSGAMLGFALALSLGTVVVFGILPSLMASRTDPAEELKEGSRGSTSGKGARYRSGLVVLQVALSLVLLVGSGLLLKSFARLRAVDPGFRVENLLTAGVSLPTEGYEDTGLRTQFFDQLKEKVEALPGVESASVINQLPILQPSGNVAIWAPERPPEVNRDAPWADRRIVLPGYFATLEIPLVEGRVFDASDGPASTPVIVLSRRTAEMVFPEERALGRQVAVDMGGDEPGLFEVVGVIEDHQTSSLQQSRPRPAMFFPYAQMPWRGMRIAVATATDPSALIRPVQEEVWSLDRSIVLSNARSMEDALAGSIADVRSVTTVLGLFASIAIALAALGLYGVLAFFVSQRVHEIGIRVALGASGGNVLRLVVTRGMVLVAVGSVLGIAGAFGATRLVSDMLYQTSTTDLSTYAGVTGVFLLVAFAACLIPAWRAVRVDPIEAFRGE